MKQVKEMGIVAVCLLLLWVWYLYGNWDVSHV